MSEGAWSILWMFTVLWIGWPLHVIAGRLTTIVKEIDRRR